MKTKKNIIERLSAIRQGRFTPQHQKAGFHQDRSKYDRKDKSWKKEW